MEEIGGGHCLPSHTEFDAYTNIHYFEKFIFEVNEQLKFSIVFFYQRKLFPVLRL